MLRYALDDSEQSRAKDMDASSRTPADTSPRLSVHADDLPLDSRPGFRTLTLRDDRLDFAGFGDAAASCRRRRARLRLIDQGRFGISELEWLAEAGTRHPHVGPGRRAGSELILIRRAAGRGGAFTALFQHGLIDGPRPRRLCASWAAAASISTAPTPRRPAISKSLAELAWDCRDGGS